jgi:hypothetical protein
VRSAAVIAGLRMEPWLAQALTVKAQTLAQSLGLEKANVAATARHLLRVSLGMSVPASLQQEEKFAQIAQAKRQLLQT